MAGWITSGISFEGIYTMYINVDSTKRYMCTYKSLTDLSNNYIRACTHNINETTAKNGVYYKFRIIYVKNEKANSASGTPSISWYNIQAVEGYTDTKLGANNFKHNLCPCNNYSTYGATNANDSDRAVTFSYENAGTANYALWGFYDKGDGTYYIVNHESWTNNSTNTYANGTVHYLVSGLTVSDNYDYLVVWSYSKFINANYDYAASWHMTRYLDGAIKTDDGVWRTNIIPYVKINGTWRRGGAIYIKDGGAWKKV